MSAYPEHPWVPWKFSRVETGFWDDLTKQRQLYDWIYQELKLSSMDDWYRVTFHQLRTHYAAGLLQNYYDNSPPRALQTIYPEHKWDQARFYQSASNVKRIAQSAEKPDG
jgi:hypothetical protein